MTTLDKLKNQLRRSGMDILKNIAFDNAYHREDIQTMFVGVGNVLADLKEVNSIHELLQQVAQDTYGTLGYDSESGEEDLFKDALG